MVNRPCDVHDRTVGEQRQVRPVKSQKAIRFWRFLVGSAVTSTTTRRELRVVRRGECGYSLVELLVVSVILLILASAIAPLTKVTIQRQRESDLRRSLREVRLAIDGYKDAVDLGVIGANTAELGNEGYPPDLEALVEGVEILNDANGRKMRFLRRIPIDPMTKSTDWGMRSYQDEPNNTAWSGDNVYDVYSQSLGKALDGTLYQEW